MGIDCKLLYRAFVASVVFSAVALVCACTQQATKQATAVSTVAAGEYHVQPGDVLFISVWREETLQREVVVQPDGVIRFPLAGEVNAKGLSLSEVEQRLANQLSKYIPDPALSVSLVQSLGNRVYVVGRVNKPGEYALSRDIDVMQALALAGGVTPFAKKSKIKILRAVKGKQEVLLFNYKEVESGERISQNIFLVPGDTVIVP